MPASNKKKKSKKSNVLPVTATFGKKKIKVGRILKKTTTTSTKIKTRKVVIMEQLRTGGDKATPVSHRGLTIDELCRRLGHYSESVCREAIIGLSGGKITDLKDRYTQRILDVKELLSAESSLITKHLRIIVPCIGRLISAGMKEESTKGQLKALMRVVFTVSSEAMSSHFGLLMNHVLTALTDIRPPRKLFGLYVLLALLRHFPALAAQRIDAFDRFLELLAAGERRPTDVTQLREAVWLFRRVYNAVAGWTSLWRPNNEMKLFVDKCEMTPARVRIIPRDTAVHFPVLYSSLAPAAAVVGQADREARLRRLDELAVALNLNAPLLKPPPKAADAPALPPPVGLPIKRKKKKKAKKTAAVKPDEKTEGEIEIITIC